MLARSHRHILWRTLINRCGDEMLDESGDLVSDGLPSAELHKRALINPAAQRADDSPFFFTSDTRRTARLQRERRAGGAVAGRREFWERNCCGAAPNSLRKAR